MLGRSSGGGVRDFGGESGEGGGGCDCWGRRLDGLGNRLCLICIYMVVVLVLQAEAACEACQFQVSLQWARYSSRR